MSVLYSDFLESAETMLSGESEMHYRNSISRAYYAAFHRAVVTAVAYCPDNSHFKMDCGNHERVIDRFTLFGHASPLSSPAKSIAYILRQIKATRTRSDYFLDEEVRLQEAETQLEQVKRLINKLDNFDNDAGDTSLASQC